MKKKLASSGDNADEKNQILIQHGYTMYKEVLGVGAFSTVRTAYSNTHKRDVAIKIIPKVNGAKEFLMKFLPRELEIMRELVHPNVIAFLQAIETNVKIYLVLELVNGGSLLQVIHQKHRLNEDNSSNVFLQLCNGMEYCHSKGVAHRDLKCENILLDKKGQVKIIDFGFGRGNLEPVKDKYLRSTTYCGSYAYACPEILQGIPYVPQLSDVWSMGVILFVMLHGYLPFEDMSLKRLIKLVLAGPIFKGEIVLTPEAKDLIIRILVTEDKRCHVSDVKKSSWLQNIDMENTMVTLNN